MRVLIVEDDRRLAANVQRALKEAGLAADIVYDGEDAIAAALATPYDVILLDLMLPKVNGLEVSRELRSRRLHSPILMLTARDSVQDRVIGLDAGADDYLVKPFALSEVMARVRALSRRHLSNRMAVLRAGPIALDTAARKLMVGEQRVGLTVKEHAILEYFMLNQGQVLSREQIIEHVWNYDFDGTNNLVEVYVSRLRRKLVEAGASDPFDTLRGAGYRFEYGAD